MFENTGETPRADSIRPLMNPNAVRVIQDAQEMPVIITFKRDRQRVSVVHELWEITDEWWRPDPIYRTYYRVSLGDGAEMTLYRDKLSGNWFQQRD